MFIRTAIRIRLYAVPRCFNLGLKVKRPRVAKGNKTYYLLKRSESVLNIVECGFLTNPEEAGLLCKEEYQNKIVEAIVKGIEQYLKQQKI